MKPENVNILGKVYKIEYCDNPIDVDVHKRKACFGQIDHWTGTIRIYEGTSDSEITDSILHEVLHGIVYNLRVKTISDASDYEDVISLLALGIHDVFERNGWIKNV